MIAARVPSCCTLTATTGSHRPVRLPSASDTRPPLAGTRPAVPGASPRASKGTYGADLVNVRMKAPVWSSMSTICIEIVSEPPCGPIIGT